MKGLGFVAAAVGTGVAQQMYRELISGKDPNDPTFAEIGKALSRGNYGLAFHWGMNRALSAIAMSGLTGTIGDYAQTVPKMLGQQTQRYHDPLAPPVLGVVSPFVALAVGWYGENGFQGAPSKGLMDKFLMSMSSQYRTIKQSGMRLAEVTGLKWDVAEQQAAYDDLSFMRSRIKLFANDNPVYRAKIQRMGTLQSSMVGRGEFAPYKDDLEAALLTGNRQQAAATIRNWLNRFPPDQRAAQLKSLKASVQASAPIRVAGSTGKQAQDDFIRWAHQKLPTEEVARMRKLVSTYSRTAQAVGLKGEEDF